MLHANNFTVLRILAASLVVVAHAYDLQGGEDVVAAATVSSFGDLGVRAFFAMSGFLIMRSLDRTPDLLRFAAARALRILPGLWIMLAVSVVAVGLFATTLPAATFFADARTLDYVVENATAFFIVYPLPGTFEANPVMPAVNGSLWTLPLEIECYALAAAAFAFGLLGRTRRRAVLAAAVGAGVAHALLPEIHVPGLYQFGGEPFARFATAFAVGMAFGASTAQPRVRAWHVLAALAAARLSVGTRLEDPALTFAVAATVFHVAYLGGPVLRAMRGLPDISYGMYIYAFPIQQALIAFGPPLHPLAHAAVALVLVAIPATASWFLVESPALRLKPRAGTARGPAPATPPG